MDRYLQICHLVRHQKTLAPLPEVDSVAFLRHSKPHFGVMTLELQQRLEQGGLAPLGLGEAREEIYDLFLCSRHAGHWRCESSPHYQGRLSHHLMIWHDAGT